MFEGTFSHVVAHIEMHVIFCTLRLQSRSQNEYDPQKSICACKRIQNRTLLHKLLHVTVNVRLFKSQFNIQEERNCYKAEVVLPLRKHAHAIYIHVFS